MEVGLRALLIAWLMAVSVAAQAALPPQILLSAGQPPSRLLATLVKGEWVTAALMREKAQQPATRAYAARVAADDASAWARLRRFASGRELEEVPELKQEWQIFRGILRNQSGATADRDYLRGELEVEKKAAAALPALGAAQPRLSGLVIELVALERRHAALARQAQAGFAGAHALGETSRGSVWQPPTPPARKPPRSAGR